MYGELTPEELLGRHQSNDRSRFTTAFNKNGFLAGYVRYTVPSLDDKQSELILIVVNPALRRLSNASDPRSISTLLMERTFADMASAGATSVIADICSGPVPNEASIRLHLAHGFKHIGSGAAIQREFPGLGLTSVTFDRCRKELGMQTRNIGN